MEPLVYVGCTVQILLIVAAWVLFQQAKSDLTARAAQIPVLSEVRALQKSIAELLEQIKLESAQTGAQLQARCAEARDLLAALDRKLEAIDAARAAVRQTARRRVVPPNRAAERQAKATDPADEAPPEEAASDTPGAVEDQAPGRFGEVYALVDDGLGAIDIARQTGYSQGEVELIIGLRSASA